MTMTDPAEPLLERLTPEARTLVQALRTRIRELMPRASETVHMGWGVIQYRAGDSMRDMVVAIAPQRTYVNIEFGDGVELPDPTGRLEGTGKRLRHVKIRGPSDVEQQEVRELLAVAARRRGL